VALKISPGSGYYNASSLQKSTIQVSNPEIHWNIYQRNYFSISKTTVLESLFIKFASKLCKWRKLLLDFRILQAFLGKQKLTGFWHFKNPLLGLSKASVRNSKQIEQQIISEKAINIASEIYVQYT